MGDRDLDTRPGISVSASSTIEGTAKAGRPDAGDAGEVRPVAPADQVEQTERNGSISGVGVVLGFSLAFTGQWSMQPAAFDVAYLIYKGELRLPRA